MNCKKISPCFLVVLLAFIVMPVFAETITVYDTYDLVLEETTEADFLTILDGNGDATQTHTDTFLHLVASSTTGKYNKIRRVPMSFAIHSSLPSGAVIDSATLYLFGSNKASALGSNISLLFTAMDPANKRSFVASDFSTISNTPLTNEISYSDWSTSGYNSFPLTAAGISHISKTDYTIFAARHNWDVYRDNSAITWASGAYSGFAFRTSRYSGTSSDPYIVITYHIPAPEVAYSCTPRTGTAPLTITCTDASSNTPTSWAWDFGDGNTSTLQNPEHTYDFAGKFSVNLSVSNAGGSDYEQKLDYIEVTAAATPTPTPTQTATTAVTTTVIPTTIPAISGACRWVNLTGATIEPNSTSWENSINVTRWGMLITDTSSGNVSWYTCLDEFIAPTPAPTGIPNFPASQIDPFSVLAKTLLENLWLVLLAGIFGLIFFR